MSSRITVGTMVLDMYDPAPKQLVWTGNATKTIASSSNQEKNQKNLNQAMQKLLKDFSIQTDAVRQCFCELGRILRS